MVRRVTPGDGSAVGGPSAELTALTALTALLALCFQLVAAIVFISFGVVAAFCCAVVDGVFAAQHIVSTSPHRWTTAPKSCTTTMVTRGHRISTPGVT